MGFRVLFDTRHVLGNGDGARADGVYKVVGEHQIDTRVHVRLETKVVPVPIDKTLANP